MIEVEHVSKFFGDFIAIEDVTFEAERGEILGFLGPNGAGKTTTMRIITGFTPPSEGTVRVAGHDVLNDSLEARRNIGYLPETVPLYTDMTVRDYLDFMGSLRQMTPAERRSRADYVIERLAIEDYVNTFIGRLSKGYRQRVGLAQAMLHEPTVLILDEPTIGIDPVQVVETRELIRGLGQDHTIVLSTHILPEVSVMCERVVVINEGRIVAVDKPENLSVHLRGSEQVRVEVRGPSRDVAARFRDLNGVRRVERSEVAAGVFSYTLECEPGSDLKESLAKIVVDQGWGLLALESASMSLEDIFLELTTREDRPAESGEKNTPS